MGSLGQYCAAALKKFGVTVCAIGAEYPHDWEVPDLAEMLDEILIGDCRQPKILEQAKIQDCQAVLLVANDEATNIEAAFAIRLLNAQVRLVVQSSKHNLNALLSQSLSNFAAFEPDQLATPAFALAALGGETQAFFYLEDQLLQVIEQQVQPENAWHTRRLGDLQGRNRRVLSCKTQADEDTSSFHKWNPEHQLRVGDIVTYVQSVSRGVGASLILDQPKGYLPTHPSSDVSPAQERQTWKTLIKLLSWQSIKTWTLRLWQATEHNRSQRVVLLCAIAILGLGSLGTLLYRLYYPQTNALEALSASAKLLLGGYGDVYGGVELPERVPVWLQLFSLGMAIAGTAFVGVIYALLTETLLSARLTFLARRPPIPKQNHVILVGLENVGQRIANFFLELKHPIVGVSCSELEANFLLQLPLVMGEIADALPKANLVSARSIIIATEDELTNLEIGLMIHAANPQAGLVIRMFDQRFSENLGRRLPYAKVFCTHALAAEAFAGAAFGENILGLFRLNHQTVLVTEYHIEAEDTLHNLLLAEVAYGYDVVPVLYQRQRQGEPIWMPSDDIRLEVGDRLIVLATITSLQRIERREIAPRHWLVRIEKVANQAALFEGVTVISLVCGCSRSVAQQVMGNLPMLLPLSLYHRQAQRLVQKLQQVMVLASWQEHTDPSKAIWDLSLHKKEAAD
jgi:Trk K+ transport system NAD-binding subunit